MKTFHEFLKHHSLVAGILLMFLFTWPVALALAGLLPLRVPNVISITFGLGISIATLIMTGLTLGRSGAITLLKRFLIWRVSWKLTKLSQRHGGSKTLVHAHGTAVTSWHTFPEQR